MYYFISIFLCLSLTFQKKLNLFKNVYKVISDYWIKLMKFPLSGKTLWGSERCYCFSRIIPKSTKPSVLVLSSWQFLFIMKWKTTFWLAQLLDKTARAGLSHHPTNFIFYQWISQNWHFYQTVPSNSSRVWVYPFLRLFPLTRPPVLPVKTLSILHTKTQKLPLWSYQSEVFLASVVFGCLSFISLITCYDVYNYLSTYIFAFLSDTLIGLWRLYLIFYSLDDMPHKKLIFCHWMKPSKTKHCEYNTLMYIFRCATNM